MDEYVKTIDFLLLPKIFIISTDYPSEKETERKGTLHLYVEIRFVI